MKDSFKTFLFAGIPFGLIMGLFEGLFRGLEFGIISGAVMGAFFGLFLSIFVYIQSKKLKKNSKQIAGDKIIVFEGAANHFVGAEGVGGWLCLTEDELVFQSNKINIQNHQLRIPLNQISGTKPVLTIGFIPNGLQIITKNGVEKFVLNNRKVWAQKINEAIVL